MYLVTGATGNVGREVARALLEAGEAVRGLSRQGARSKLPNGVEPATGDLNDPASLAAALRGVSGIFVLPGYESLPDLLRRARAAGVDRVVLLSGRSAADGDLSNAISAYMIRSEDAVRDGGIPWTIVRPSAFHSNALQWLPQLRAGDVISAPFATVPVANLDPYDIGNVAATALRHDEYAGRTYELSGPEPLLPADRVRILGNVLGRELTLHAQPDDEARAEMLTTTPPEYVDAFFKFYVEGTLDESPILPTVHELTGQEPRTFEQWAIEHADEFR